MSCSENDDEKQGKAGLESKDSSRSLSSTPSLSSVGAHWRTSEFQLTDSPKANSVSSDDSKAEGETKDKEPGHHKRYASHGERLLKAVTSFLQFGEKESKEDTAAKRDITLRAVQCALQLQSEVWRISTRLTLCAGWYLHGDVERRARWRRGCYAVPAYRCWLGRGVL